MATNDLTFETGNGAEVTVSADGGVLWVEADGDGFSFETTARLDTARGMDVLNCGTQRDDSGDRFQALIPVDDRREAIEQIREDSKSDEPLAYEVEEYTKTIRSDWGNNEVTKQRLAANKSYTEMDDRERELDLKIDADRDVPEDAEPGDVFAPDDLLADARTEDEREQDALDEAAETGEEVVIRKSVTDCNDPREECNLDHVTKVATPDGEIETRRVHTY